MYAQVLLREGTTAGTEAVQGHEEFIDGLIRRNGILPGGKWGAAAGPFVRGYLLHRPSLDEARTIAARDPYVRAEVYGADVVEWDLVGIDPKAIDPECILTGETLEGGSWNEPGWADRGGMAPLLLDLARTAAPRPLPGVGATRAARARQ